MIMICGPAHHRAGELPVARNPSSAAMKSRRRIMTSGNGEPLKLIATSNDLEALTRRGEIVRSWPRTRLDRLAQSTLDLLSILRRVTEAGAKFKSLKDPWADTTTPHGELMVTILAGLATFERHLIKARTDEGRTRAKGRGVRFGRPPKLTSYQRAETLQRLAAGESQADVARAYNVHPAAICRLAAAPA
jgi:hypothetical protein